MTDSLIGAAADAPPAETMSKMPAWLGRTAALLGLVALALAVWSAVLGVDNRALGKTVGEQQGTVARAQTLAQVNNALIQLISRTAAQTDDAELASLLAKNGVTFQTPSRAPGAPQPDANPNSRQGQ